MANGNGAKNKRQLIKDSEALPLGKGGPAVLEITERKRAEEALQAEKNKLRSVTDAMEDGLSIQDKDYNIIYQNESLRKNYGGHMGEKCYRVYEGRDKLCDGCPVEKAFRDGKSHTSVRKVILPSGQVAFGENTASLIRDAKGKIVSCLEIVRDITERKQMEEALQAERNKLQSVINAMEDGLNIMDRDYNVIYQNGLPRRLFGDRLGEKCYQVYAGSKELCDGCPVKKAFKDGKSHTSEKKLLTPSGEVTFWETTANPIRDAEGKIVSCLEIARNITEHKQAEEALRESEERFRSIVENSQAGIMILNDAYQCIYVNDELCRIAQYSHEEIVGQDFRQFLDEESRQLVTNRYIRRQRGEEVPPRYEFNIVRKDGQKRRVEIHSTIIRDSAGKVKTVTQLLDITERKRVQEELQAERNKLQSLISSIEYTLTIQDKDFNIIYQNESSKLASGGDHVGEKCYRIYEGRETVCDGCPVAKAFKDGKSHTSERRRTEPSGEITFWENTASPIRDAKGNITSCLELARDITERKQMEEELQAEKNKLQSLIGAMEFSLTMQDKDFNIIYQNEPSQRTSAGSHVGEKCYRVYEGRDTVCDGCPMAKAFKDGKSHTSERQRIVPSGEMTYWENTASPIRDANGKIISCLEIGVNITERKKAEEALRESEARYRAVVEGAYDMIQSVSPDGRIIFVNKAWRDTLGYTEAELSSLNLFDIIHPDSRAHCEETFEKVVKGQSVGVEDVVLLAKDGRKVLIEGSATPRYIGDRLVATHGIFRDITERKQAEEALASEAIRRRILIDQSRDGIVVLDEKGKVYEANLKFAEMLRYTPEEVRELHVWDWEFQYPPEQVAEMIRTVDETGDHFETKHRRKDGTIYDVEISTNGAIIARQKLIFCVCRDITARKQAEKALVEAEEKYKKLVEAASDIIWEADAQGVYTFVSPNIKDLLGYEVEEVVGKKRTLDFTPKKEFNKWLRRFKTVNARKRPFSGFEVLHLHKNGFPVIFEVSGIPLFDSAGNFKGYTGINKDVTLREKMTEALKESQEFSTSLMENSPNPTTVLNPDTSIKYVNPAFEKLTGYKLAEVVGRKVPYPWWPKEESKTMALALKKAMVSGGKKSEHVFHKKNGEPFWVMLNSAPVVHRKKLLYFLISWLDITDLKRAEEEKAEMEEKAHLASRLASVGEMASGIAHEINNPLTAVIGFAQLLMDTELPEEIKEDLVIIHKEAQRAAGVARNLLTFARKHAPAKQPTNVNSIIEGVLTLRAYEQKVSNIQIVTKLAPDMPEVMADYSQLQQVFINIILNAEAAMLEANNGGKLTITTQKLNHSVRASFADDGPGITKENLDRIFDPFFTTKEVGKGTGLGLSVCHGIIAEHGGKIYARSKLGNGATFIVELPISSQGPAEEPNEPA
jgi:PAS domain S-box-containing protein